MFDLYRAQDLIDQTEIYIKLFKINKTMIDLNQEAINFEQSKLKEIGLTTSKTGAWSEGFIAGANSKYVKQLIIQAQIDVLEGVDGEYYYNYPIYKKIEELKQQLKQLENE
jgi:hypothetical protein